MTEHPQHCDILVIGTGFYAEVMLADLAAHARKPLSVAICGRNAERMKWLVEACRARAVNFGSPASFSSVPLDSTSIAALAEGIGRVRPRIVVQSASAQSPWKVDNGENEWARLVAKAGFGLTLAFNALLAFRTASAIRELGEEIIFVNTCYPDGVNQVLAQAGLPISTGVGNIGIFASVIGGRIPFEQRPELRVLAHHRHIVEWRKPGTQRAGAPVRAWVGDAELNGIDDLTRDIQLPYRDLNMISAAMTTPLLSIFGKSCWQITAFRLSATIERICDCWLGGKTSSIRSMVDGALLVCRVPNTKCPVSEARMAISTVSKSRNSPMTITSGSSRRTALRALWKLLVCRPNSR